MEREMGLREERGGKRGRGVRIRERGWRGGKERERG